MTKFVAIAVSTLCLAACSHAAAPPDEAPAKTDAQYREEAVQGMHDALLAQLQTLTTAVTSLEADAPAPSDRGWDVTEDADAIGAMRRDWVRARTAYELVEGALAPLFPDIDFSIDARYDDFMSQLASEGGDHDLFDDQGVTGLHAVERILYADVTPERVIAFERSLPGYVPAAFPATAGQASEFKTKLCAKLIADAKELVAQWTPANIDEAIAFQGLISLMNEQREKVQKASSDEEESRYSQRTMADLRDNLEGTTRAFAFFAPWIASKSSSATGPGASIVRDIEQGFDSLGRVYASISSDAIPPPPASWSAENPSMSDLKSPFGQLYTEVEDAVDQTNEGSIVAQMNDAADLLGFPTFSMGSGQ
jgi:iron uptake system component EfeO